ncbi:sigma-54-dependent transcriptional regulator [Nitrincola tapanii]|uniref:Sigma-54-dependent Fis family transcriptional regulator n=1 Tax=Nitrincola tapanii TaxID=1708751 RepID=A0A5A9W0A8_9GAMM|nr:sigma-54 dependent transcriptional regulator [Nitrincola tapanii]KAA0874190.1 sigma-54-dependent Fis family transcriptional regulator [Nitrincola tapanii]
MSVEQALPLNAVALIDDDPAVLEATGQWLQLSGFVVSTWSDPQQALQELPAEFPGVVVSDIRMPNMDGLALMQALQAKSPGLPVLLMTGHADIPLAVTAMRQGAWDFLEKPYDPERLEESVQRALQLRSLQWENAALKAQMVDPVSKRLLGQSSAILHLRQQIQRLARTATPVLILGETGAGKEVVARALHEASARAQQPFVAINCGALARELIESELFGHQKGAFTGAATSRAGKLEHASGGTLFLDEIESMPLDAQVKLLRALQEQEIERLGSNQPIKVDLRVIAATKVDLLKLAEQGQFREDLYYRLAVAELSLPPLRERQQDILLLFQHFALQAAEVHEMPLEALPAGLAAALLQHPWRGNVRELRNAATRYVLGLEPIATEVDRASKHLAEQLAEVEKALIAQSLQRHQGHIQAVMEELGLPRRTLNQKMLRHGLRRDLILKYSDLSEE